MGIIVLQPIFSGPSDGRDSSAGDAGQREPSSLPPSGGVWDARKRILGASAAGRREHKKGRGHVRWLCPWVKFHGRSTLGRVWRTCVKNSSLDRGFQQEEPCPGRAALRDLKFLRSETPSWVHQTQRPSQKAAAQGSTTLERWFPQSSPDEPVQYLEGEEENKAIVN